MIQMQTHMGVADNSGAKTVMCIKVLGGSHHMLASLGDVVIVAVKTAIPGGKVKKGEIVSAIIVRSKYGARRRDGTSIKFDTNDVVLLNKQLEPFGTRVFGPVAREVRDPRYNRKFDKIASLAQEVV